MTDRSFTLCATKNKIDKDAHLCFSLNDYIAPTTSDLHFILFFWIESNENDSVWNRAKVDICCRLILIPSPKKVDAWSYGVSEKKNLSKKSNR